MGGRKIASANARAGGREVPSAVPPGGAKPIAERQTRAIGRAHTSLRVSGYTSSARAQGTAVPALENLWAHISQRQKSDQQKRLYTPPLGLLSLPPPAVGAMAQNKHRWMHSW